MPLGESSLFPFTTGLIVLRYLFVIAASQTEFFWPILKVSEFTVTLDYLAKEGRTVRWE